MASSRPRSPNRNKGFLGAFLVLLDFLSIYLIMADFHRRLEKDMAPTSESTKFEGSDGFVEYRAANKLEGKKALITGGDSGIGRAVAALYAREGADVSIVYLPEEQEDANETKRLVEEVGRKCNLIPFNLEDLHNLDKVVKNHLDAIGGLDILVNNASKQVQTKDFADLDIDKMESVFKSNILQSMFSSNCLMC